MCRQGEVSDLHLLQTLLTRQVGLRRKGLRVPQDVALVGCDGLTLAEQMDIPITSVGFPLTEMCRAAVPMLLERVEARSENSENKMSLPPRQQMFPTMLHMRESSRCYRYEKTALRASLCRSDACDLLVSRAAPLDALDIAEVTVGHYLGSGGAALAPESGDSGELPVHSELRGRVPGQALLIPTYLIVRSLGWFDTYLALIVPEGAIAFGVILLRQFFIELPKELEEAAVLDGCTQLGVLWNVILPLSKPALAALGILTFMGAWNAFGAPLLFTDSLELRTLPIRISVLQGRYNTEYGPMMAAATLAALPAAVAFLLFQRQIIKGISLTGVAGR